MAINEGTVQRIESYRALFTAAAREHQVPAALLLGLCAAESDGQSQSGAGTAGYKGLLQAEKDDAQLDPAVSIQAGAKKVKTFLASLERLLGAIGLRFDDQTEASSTGLWMSWWPRWSCTGSARYRCSWWPCLCRCGCAARPCA